MSVIDVDSLVGEISAEAPAGADVEYDPEYFELEKMARGTPASEIGDAKKEAEEPEWKAHPRPAGGEYPDDFALEDGWDRGIS